MANGEVHYFSFSTCLFEDNEATATITAIAINNIINELKAIN